ncbi:MAG: cell wall hydrolase [Sphingomicrobium sp.]
MIGVTLTKSFVQRFTWTALVAIGLFVSLASAVVWAFAASRADAVDAHRKVSVTATLSPAAAAKLVDATSASPEQVRAIGDKAKLINAALPFGAGPVQAANPFAIDGGLNHRRALLCLTQAVYYEAGFEPMAGRRAVAQVVLNRMRHPAFPKSVCGVVYHVARAPVCQFSFVCDGSLNRAPSPLQWQQARAIAQAALSGYVESSVGSATHYHADYVAPRWAPMLTKLAKLGAHIFYRWPGSWGERAAFTGAYRGEAVDPSALRPIILAKVGTEGVVEPVEAGPPIARAPQDVGGLLDTTKGWTLTIPSPTEVSSASARALAQQRAATGPKPIVALAAGAAPVVVAQ